MSVTERKPKLTAKVLDGLAYMAAHVSAGDYMEDGGDLGDEVAPQVSAALKWINRMQGYRARLRSGEGGKG